GSKHRQNIHLAAVGETAPAAGAPAPAPGGMPAGASTPRVAAVAGDGAAAGDRALAREHAAPAGRSGCPGALEPAGGPVEADRLAEVAPGARQGALVGKLEAADDLARAELPAAVRPARQIAPDLEVLLPLEARAVGVGDQAGAPLAEREAGRLGLDRDRPARAVGTHRQPHGKREAVRAHPAQRGRRVPAPQLLEAPVPVRGAAGRRLVRDQGLLAVAGADLLHVRAENGRLPPRVAARP